MTVAAVPATGNRTRAALAAVLGYAALIGFTDNFVRTVAEEGGLWQEHAMRTAMAMFPQSAITVLHGYEVPMAGLMDTTREQMLAAVRDQALADGREFIARCQPPGGVGSVSLVVERGDPSLLMRMYASQYPVDLAVVATHGRSALLDVMLGSVAQRLLEDLPLDTLVVRKPSADAS